VRAASVTIGPLSLKLFRRACEFPPVCCFFVPFEPDLT
jgi:hypothetical protein